MALPQFGGAITMRHSGDNSAVIDTSTVPVGAWMILSVMSSVSSLTITAPSGWTVLHSREVTGTRANFLFGKIKESSDGNSATFTQSVTLTIAYGLVWGTGGEVVSTWTIGNSWIRASSTEPSGARYTNIAPSITTTSDDQLVVAFSNEATNALAQANEVTNYTSGWTQQMYLQQVAPSDRIETLWAATKPMSSAGATGNASITYVSPVDSNGWGIQIAIPAVSSLTVQTPQVVGTPSVSVTPSVSTSFTVNRPSGIVNGDYIVVIMRGQASDCTVEPSSAGFTHLGPSFVTSSVSYRTNGIYGRPVSDATTEPRSYTFTISSGSGRVIATALIVRGVDITNPVSGYFNSYSGTVITNGRQIDTYTIARAPSLALFYAGSEFTASNSHTPLTTPSGYTAHVSANSSGGDTSVSRSYVWVGSQVISSGASVPSGSITWGNPTAPAAQGVALNGSTSAPVDPAGVGLATRNGSGQTVRTFYTTTDGPRTPSAIIPMRRGFNSVSDMLAKPGFTWAHRGGSASYPEHSLYAYTQSVARGYGVLEISLARTSDGVWFGLHDQTTDRTSGGSFGNASSQTWAQIQAQQIVVGSQGAPQPYMSWSQLVAKYGKTHIIVADPKYALSYQTEFLNMVNNDLGPTRAIIKYSGVGSGAAALSTAAQALGFQTWGFFYATDASASQGGSGALQTWAGSWTLLGMEYGASQAIWNEALAFGKPVIGHIAPNQAAYNTAMTKGASGVQVSGVGVVAPVSWWT